ncbi:hypothetical protein BSIN_1875 [Burkholderia singularis]|uniref:Uncharacterized protein n=1 Tax=Burkholderia singularis TaxID=1503053 RepID=A0A238H059_9BURK|nr:hypothetical protein BSIN_1875 [Burkholderia singularis]
MGASRQRRRASDVGCRCADFICGRGATSNKHWARGLRFDDKTPSVWFELVESGSDMGGDGEYSLMELNGACGESLIRIHRFAAHDRATSVLTCSSKFFKEKMLKRMNMRVLGSPSEA